MQFPSCTNSLDVQQRVLLMSIISYFTLFNFSKVIVFEPFPLWLHNVLLSTVGICLVHVPLSSGLYLIM